MPRIIEITVPPEQTESLVAEIAALAGLIGMRVQRGISVQPARLRQRRGALLTAAGNTGRV